MNHDAKKEHIDETEEGIPIFRQCELLGISRSSYYYTPTESLEKQITDEAIMRCLDEIYTMKPFYGTRRMKYDLRITYNIEVGRKLIRRLMRKLGIKALYPEPKTTIPNREHKKYPYLLRNKEILAPNEVWSTDITYIRMKKGWIYLTAIIDWYSRYIISWRISITLDTEFCTDALQESLLHTKPLIFNSDQGSQYTSYAFTSILEQNEIQISMDGKGRCLDNIFVERFWRTIKQEEVYIKAYDSVQDAYHNIKNYIHFYNNDRPHQSLGYKTPAEIYFQKINITTKTPPKS